MSKHQKTSLFERIYWLEKQVRQAHSLKHLAFIIANHSKKFIPYAQAAIWQKAPLGLRIYAISATSSINQNSPYIRWLQNECLPWLLKNAGNEVKTFSSTEIPSKLKQGWDEYMTDYLLFCPFVKEDKTSAGILLSNPEPWSESEVSIAKELQEIYSYAWFAMTKPATKPKLKKFFKSKRFLKITGITAGIIVLLLIIPIKLSVLAPAEIAPQNPILVSASIKGMIKTVNVKPNSLVKKNQLLFTLDSITLQNRYNQAQQSLHIAQEKYRQANQHALHNPGSKNKLSLLKAEVEKQKNELAYARDLLGRSKVRAEKDGVIIFSSPEHLLGKPINIGERVMLLASQDKKQLDVKVAADDMIQIKRGYKVSFFPNIDPLHSIEGTVNYASFIATPVDNETLAYEVVADFSSDKKLPRFGSQGTAKIYGKRVSLFFYLFKRPLVFIQSWLGV